MITHWSDPHDIGEEVPGHSAGSMVYHLYLGDDHEEEPRICFHCRKSVQGKSTIGTQGISTDLLQQHDSFESGGSYGDSSSDDSDNGACARLRQACTKGFFVKIEKIHFVPIVAMVGAGLIL
jgi:hypothetical protein